MAKIAIIILLTICQYANSKEMNTEKDPMNFYTSEQIENSTKRAISSFSESSCKCSRDTISIVYIFQYGYNGSLKKKDFLDHSFFSKLIPLKQKKYMSGENYVDIDFLLETKDGSIIGSGNAYEFYPECSNQRKQKSKRQFILDEMKKKRISYLFMINKLSNWPVFGVTDDNQVFVFDYLDRKFTALSLNEFITKRPNSVFEKWDVDD